MYEYIIYLEEFEATEARLLDTALHEWAGDALASVGRVDRQNAALENVVHVVFGEQIGVYVRVVQHGKDAAELWVPANRQFFIVVLYTANQDLWVLHAISLCDTGTRLFAPLFFVFGISMREMLREAFMRVIPVDSFMIAHIPCYPVKCKKMQQQKSKP